MSGPNAGPTCRTVRFSDGNDVLRLEALLALRDVELDLLALLELTETLSRDVGVVSEDVAAAAVLLDEAEALFRVEPLHGTGGHIRSFREAITEPAPCGPRCRNDPTRTDHPGQQKCA